MRKREYIKSSYNKYHKCLKIVLYKNPFNFTIYIQTFSKLFFIINANFLFNVRFEYKLNNGYIAQILAQNIFPSGKSNELGEL